MTHPFAFLLAAALVVVTFPLFLAPSVRADKCPPLHEICMEENNCKLPKCLCASEFPSMGMEREDIPQLVVFAFSGPLNENTWKPLRRIFDNEGVGSKRRVNPNDEPISMTLFVSDEGTDDYCRAGEFYRDGHEIGVNGVNDKHSMDGREPSAWKSVMMRQREKLAKEAKIDVLDIGGMRAPALEAGGDGQFEGIQLMNASNWLPYDSSIVLDENDYLKNTVPIWPYTMDFKYDDTIRPWNHHPTTCYPGVWEVPLQRFRDRYNRPHDFIDDWAVVRDDATLYSAIANNFWRHYSKNRVPFIINARTSWFQRQPDAVKAVERFIDVIIAHDLMDVYVVSMEQMLEWVKNPVPLVELNTAPSLFKKPTRRNGAARCNSTWLRTGQNAEGNEGWVAGNSVTLPICVVSLILLFVYIAKGGSQSRRFRMVVWYKSLCRRWWRLWEGVTV